MAILDFDAVYPTLSLEEKNFLHTLAFIGSTAQSMHQEFMNKNGYKFSPLILWNNVNMRETKEHLTRQKFIIAESNNMGKYKCHEEIKRFFLSEKRKTAETPNLVRKVLQAYPNQKTGYSYSYSFEPASFEMCKRDVQLVLMGELYEMFWSYYNIAHKFFPLEAARELSLHILFLSPFDGQRFDKYPAEFASNIFEKIILEGIQHGNLIPDIVISYIKSYKKEPKEGAGLIETILAIYYIMRGDLVEGRYYAGKAPDEEQALLLGWIKLLQGEIETSIQYYLLATKIWRKTTGKKKGFPLGFMGDFFLFSLLKSKSVEHQNLFSQQLDFALKENPYSIFYQKLDAARALSQNRKNEAEDFLKLHPPRNLSDFVWHGIASVWIKASMLDVKTYQEFCAKAAKNGYKYWELELSHILASIDSLSSEIMLANAQRISKQTGIQSLSDTLEAVEDWQLALNVLLNSYANIKPATAEGSSRLVWFVDFEKKTLQPAEQKLGKNGWSAGKNVALKRFKEKEVISMTQQDKDIADKGIVQESYGWGYYNNTPSIDFEKTVKLLIGHPLMFLNYSPTTPVELQEEELVLQVEKTNNGYEIRFSENFPLDVDYLLRKETNTRWKYMPIKEHHRKIVSSFSANKLVIPDKGKDQLNLVVNALANAVKIQSDVTEHLEHLPEVAPEMRVHALIVPFGDGLKLEILSKPFGSVPPYFKPGKAGEVAVAEINGERVKTLRNRQAEIERAQEIIDTCPTLALNDNKDYEWTFTDDEECLNVLMEFEPIRKDNLLILEWPKGEKLRIAQTASFNEMAFRIQKNNDWFGVQGEMTLEDGTIIELQELLKLLGINNKSNFIRLSDGYFLALTKEFRKRLKELEGITESGKNGLQFHKFASGLVDEFTSEIENLQTDKAWKEQIKKITSAKKLKPKVPSTFEAELRPYQEEGFRWLSQLAHWGVGACLADDMGLGKTVQALALLVDRASKGPALVVAPVSVCRNWENETLRFAPTLNLVLFGQGDRQETMDKLGKFDVLVASYGLLQGEAEMFEKKEFATIILDEAQAIKNRNTKRSQAAMNLNGDFKILTTGTPVENHLGELWNLFRFLNPGLLGSADRFNEKFAIPIEKNNDSERREQLKKLIQPFVLRRRKNQVLKDLPDKTEINLSVELSADERAFYEALRRNALERIADAGKNGEDARFQILAELTRMRLACCNTKLVNPDVNIPSSKMEVLKDLIDELLENGHKALIFSQFVKHLALVETLLKEKGVHYQYLDGSTPGKERQNRIEKFQSGEGDIFLISLKAGGTGLNLTAADYVIHLDPWWNPAVEDQASDRAHRIGQKRPVTIYRLVTAETVEEKIVGLHEHKRDLADSLLSGTDVSGRLTSEDLVALIKGM